VLGCGAPSSAALPPTLHLEHAVTTASVHKGCSLVLCGPVLLMHSHSGQAQQRRGLQTYAKATVYPGPRLNLVLGPNGAASHPRAYAVAAQPPAWRMPMPAASDEQHGSDHRSVWHCIRSVALIVNLHAGSGKSSIVCAVGLALCASSKARPSCLSPKNAFRMATR
jgi:hypothetical protein